jgi:hypothetical protein
MTDENVVSLAAFKRRGTLHVEDGEFGVIEEGMRTSDVSAIVEHMDTGAKCVAVLFPHGPKKGLVLEPEAARLLAVRLIELALEAEREG